MKATRQYIAQALLGIFLLALCAPLCVDQSIVWHKKYVRHHQQSTKPGVKLEFSHEAWASVERVNDHEIKIAGKMFDVRSLTKTATGVSVTGHYDTHEDGLVSLSKNLKKKTERTQKPLPLFLQVYIEEYPQFQFGYAAESMMVHFPCPVNFTTTCLGTDSPPPKKLA